MVKKRLLMAGLSMVVFALIGSTTVGSADAAGELSVSGLKLSSSYAKPSATVVLEVTVTNTDTDPVDDIDAEVSFPGEFTLLDASDVINIGTLDPLQKRTVSWSFRAPATQGKSTNEFEVEADGLDILDNYVSDIENSWLSLHIDGQPPTFITSKTKKKMFESTESFKYSIKGSDKRSVDSGLAGYQFQYLESGVWRNGPIKISDLSSSSHTLTCLNGQTCTVRVVAIDRAGNEAASEPYSVTVDTQAPVIKASAPARLRADKTLKLAYSALDPSASGLASFGFSQPHINLYSNIQLAKLSSGTMTLRPRDRERYGKKTFTTKLYASDRAGNQVMKQLTVKQYRAVPKLGLKKAKLVPVKRKGAKRKNLHFTVRTSKLAEGRLKASILWPRSWKRFKLSKRLKGKGKATYRFKVPKTNKRRVRVRLKFYGDKIFLKRTVTKWLRY